MRGIQIQRTEVRVPRHVPDGSTGQRQVRYACRFRLSNTSQHRAVARNHIECRRRTCVCSSGQHRRAAGCGGVVQRHIERGSVCANRRALAGRERTATYCGGAWIDIVGGRIQRVAVQPLRLDRAIDQRHCTAAADDRGIRTSAERGDRHAAGRDFRADGARNRSRPGKA
ncbi:hypothetical protein D3C71_1466370 [compost metagenome]